MWTALWSVAPVCKPANCGHRSHCALAPICPSSDPGGLAMRKVTFGGANSLDNFFARPDHSVDWLLWSDEAAAVMTDYWKHIDTVLMGRKTYEVALRTGQGGGSYPGVKTYVFSRTLKKDAEAGATIISQDAVEFVRKLKGQLGKDICLMGGGELARSLF